MSIRVQHLKQILSILPKLSFKNIKEISKDTETQNKEPPINILCTHSQVLLKNSLCSPLI